MNLRRLVAALIALAFVLALGFAPGPAQAGASVAGMPCHSDEMPPLDDGERPAAEPSCCQPLCWLAVALGLDTPGARLRPTFARSVPIMFVSLAERPRVPPPRA